MGYGTPLENVIIRRLYAPDLANIRDHLLRLDAGARRARFCGVASDLMIATYAQSILRNNSIVCGVLADGHLRGLAELHGVHACGQSQAEAAFSVEPAWQDIGIGEMLFARSMMLAQNRFIKSVRFMFQKRNIRMWHLAQKHDAVLSFDQELITANITPNWPTLVSLAAEFYGDQYPSCPSSWITWARRYFHAPSSRWG